MHGCVTSPTNQSADYAAICYARGRGNDDINGDTRGAANSQSWIAEAGYASTPNIWVRSAAYDWFTGSWGNWSNWSLRSVGSSATLPSHIGSRLPAWIHIRDQEYAQVGWGCLGVPAHQLLRASLHYHSQRSIRLPASRSSTFWNVPHDYIDREPRLSAGANEVIA